MTLELVSSRLVARHVGASLTVWTSVIGIILGGICLGNVLGGRLADRVDRAGRWGRSSPWASFLTIFTLWMNAFVGILLPSSLGIPWELRTVLVVSLVFLVPATVLGMVGPVVAKMAVEQARKAGSAIGDVYFSGRGGLDHRYVLLWFRAHLSGALVDHRAAGRRGTGGPGRRADER